MKTSLKMAVGTEQEVKDVQAAIGLLESKGADLRLLEWANGTLNSAMARYIEAECTAHNNGRKRRYAYDTNVLWKVYEELVRREYGARHAK